MSALMQIALLSVIGSWVAFMSLFIIKAWRVRIQRNAEPTPDSGMKTAPVARLGIFIEGVGFFISYLPRPPGESPHDVLVITAIVLAPASVFLSYLAVNHLGKQWRIKAAVTDQHELVTSGPYRFVRHPIYASMFGLLLSNAFVNAGWVGILAAISVFLVGTEIRIRAEEGLLRAKFGGQFDAYRGSVPAYIPFLR
jgi:protein-S-isoprenylcysteine O-methyltransferase Ste14